jgi:hypothetical protein
MYDTYEDSYSQPSRMSTMNPRGPIVDLKLAQTYVPGLYCLLRSSIVILVMTRTNISEDMSSLLIMSIILYVDRTIRNESIFDSNALTMSVLLGHIFNLLRIREVPIDSQFVNVHDDKTTTLTKLGVTVQLLYCLISWVSVSDWNIANLCPTLTPVLHSYTVCIHALFLSTMIFMHMSKESTTQLLTIVRSISFTLLSILWTYIVGVNNTVTALHHREDCKVIPKLYYCYSTTKP